MSLKSSRSKLALFGGNPEVVQPKPHADRACFDDADREILRQYLNASSPRNSWFGREGLLSVYEEELADYFGRRYCVLTNSGTSALFTAYFAAGIEPGDEVIAPVYTFHATITPALQLGAVPVLGDIDQETGNLSPDAVEAAITPRTKAIAVNHQWGHPANGPRLRSIADRHGLVLIEDVSLALGASLDGELTGSFGHFACLSLGSTKLISGGQGGAILMDSDLFWDRANLVGHFSLRSQEAVISPTLRNYADTGFGHNFRMHPLAVVVSRSRFQRRNELIEKRHERYSIISKALEDCGLLVPPLTRAGAFRGAWHGYCATFPDTIEVPRVLITKALQAEGLEIAVGGYLKPLSHSALFSSDVPVVFPRTLSKTAWRRVTPAQFPAAEAYVDRVVGFPLFLDEPLELLNSYGRVCSKVAEGLGVSG